MVFNVFATLAQFKSHVISERTKHGQELAKGAGRRWGHRSVCHDLANLPVVVTLLRDLSVSRGGGRALKRLGAIRAVQRLAEVDAGFPRPWREAWT